MTPPAGVNTFYIKAAATIFRSAAGVGTELDFGVELSTDGGATWAVAMGRYAGGSVTNKQGTVIDYVDTTFGLGHISRPAPLPPLPVLSDANTRVRITATAIGAPIALGPGTLTMT